MRAHELSVVGGDRIRVGGSELILLFLESALRLRMDRLHILAPYVDDAAFAEAVFRETWDRVLDTTEATIVVRTTGAAEALLRSLAGRPRRCHVRINGRLHAKVFVASRPGAEIALAGSHNLTGAALQANEEVGVLIRPGEADELRALVRQLREFAVEIARHSDRCPEPLREVRR
ncbi:MAG: hypothetical protein EYC70_13305 [Planctomycetota bacterium]|nr:MAG: hypothetical protein EYC70_13305 [Planctomycetota bacterium]